MNPSVAAHLKRASAFLLLALWLVGIATGYYWLSAYSLRRGAADLPSLDASAAAVRAWQTPGRPLIVMVLHPQCPCSQASIDELSDVLGWTPEAADLALLVYRPSGAADAWTEAVQHTSLDRFHPRIVVDADGVLARALGARTSGHVVAYDRRGGLAYSGGLTGGRGHRGKTDGQQALRDLLADKRPGLCLAPVYGCPIQSSVKSASQP